MKIWIDGAGSSIEGQPARYCVLFEDGNSIIDEVPKGTNNEMEYFALLKALKDPRSQQATIFTDSQLLVGQLTKAWKVNAENLKPVHDECRSLLDSRNARLIWIRREENRAGRVLEKSK